MGTPTSERQSALASFSNFPKFGHGRDYGGGDDLGSFHDQQDSAGTDQRGRKISG
jgi:hypothetical protein